MKQQQATACSAHRVGIVFPSGSEQAASVDQLKERIRSATRVESQARAIRVKAAAELQRRRGQAPAEHAVREHSSQSARGSRAEVETGGKLKDLPTTERAFSEGSISFNHAKIIADTAGRVKIDEKELVHRAQREPVDVFARTARQHEQQRSEDDGLSRLEEQHRARKASIRVDRADGMTILWARFDPITGTRIRNILSRITSRMWREEDPKNRPSPGQRMADALAEVMCETKGGNGKKRSCVPTADLLLIANYDTQGQHIRNARLADGTPIPTAVFQDAACQGKVVPAVFDTNGQPLWVGRGKRIATASQRLALIARDRRCIGCGADPAWCQAHHIIPWSAGGPTDLDNLCLLCSRCHHRVHDEGWQVEQTQPGRYVLNPPPPAVPDRPPRRRRRPVTKLLL